MPKKDAPKKEQVDTQEDIPQVADAKQATSIGLENLPIDELRGRVTKGMILVSELRRLFPELIGKTEDDRKYTQGNMRAGEGAMLLKVLDAADARPHYFASLADRDEGHDPKKFETTLLRDRIERRELYNQVADGLVPLGQLFNDTSLHFGELARPPTLAAYRIAKTLADTDQAVRTLIADVIDFFRIKRTKK
ncbi:MAG: hypothetical protein U0441_12960 [Polyangiaceae bacterium]